METVTVLQVIFYFVFELLTRRRNDRNNEKTKRIGTAGRDGTQFIGGVLLKSAADDKQRLIQLMMNQKIKKNASDAAYTLRMKHMSEPLKNIWKDFINMRKRDAGLHINFDRVQEKLRYEDKNFDDRVQEKLRYDNEF